MRSGPARVGPRLALGGRSLRVRVGAAPWFAPSLGAATPLSCLWIPHPSPNTLTHAPSHHQQTPHSFDWIREAAAAIHSLFVLTLPAESSTAFPTRPLLGSDNSDSYSVAPDLDTAKIATIAPRHVSTYRQGLLKASNTSLDIHALLLPLWSFD